MPRFTQRDERQLADALAKENEPEKKQEKIHLGDTPALKRALDDAALETLSSVGYNISYKYVDIKIALGLAACVIACIAQFWPKKHPAVNAVLFVCVSLYAVLSVALTAFASYIEKDTIALAKGNPEIVIRSRLPRFQETYTLGIRPKGVEPGSSGETRLESSVGAYFDSEGVLAAERFTADVKSLAERAVAGNGGRGAAAGKKSQ